MKRNRKRKFWSSAWQSVVCIVLAVVLFLVYYKTHTINENPLIVLGIVIGFYLILTAFVLWAGQSAQNPRKKEHTPVTFSANDCTTLTQKVSVPMVLCNENGLIVWANEAFNQISDISPNKTRTLRSILSFGSERFNEAETDVEWEHNDRVYIVKSVKAKDNKLLVWWIDVTEERKLIVEKEKTVTHIAYIFIDNIEELAQIEKENATSVISSISNLLFEWAGKTGGVLKELERNKYVYLFNDTATENIRENAAQIIKDVRYRSDSTNPDIPATISVGIAIVPGTLLDKDDAAKAALELALARGGDQAVIKTPRGVEFIGGVIKSTQKRSTVKSRTIANKLSNLIYGSSNVLIMAHKFPDFDAIGACVGIARFAMQCGKSCYIISDHSNLDLQKCRETLKPLHPYDNMFISPSEAMELNFSETLLIIVDVNNVRQFESPEIADLVRKIVFIDHHRMTGEFVKTPYLHYIEPSASSTCELICEILEQSTAGSRLSKPEADLLFAGIMLDTKNFIINTGVRTFAAAQYLRGQGANPAEAQDLFKSGVDELIQKAKFESQVQIYRKCTAIAINPEPLEACNANVAAIAKVADNLLNIEGILASFAISQFGEKVRISGRSTGKINVQKILEALGGGGHYDSAAALSASSIDELEANLKKAIDCYLDD